MRRHTVVIRFAKKGMMRFISHLDLLRLFERSSRRAGLPLILSEGFNPHPKIKIEPAVKLGVESSCLTAEIVLGKEICAEEVEKKLKEQLPEDIEISGVRKKE